MSTMNAEELAKKKEEYSKGKWLVFDDIEEGMEFPPVVFEVTPELINGYCKAMGDENPVYVDHETARRKGFYGAIAPSTIICIYAIPSALLSGYNPKVIPPPGNIHFRQEYEFFKSICPGETIRVKSVVIKKEIRNGRKFVTIESEYLDKDGGKIAVGRITPVWSK